MIDSSKLGVLVLGFVLISCVVLPLHLKVKKSMEVQQKVVVFVVDGFWNDSHGEQVITIIKEICGESVLINTKDAFHDVIGPGDYYTKKLIDIVEFMEQNPETLVIVNISLGHEHVDFLEYLAILGIKDKGGLIFSSAGNIEDKYSKKSSFVTYPARYPEVIAVAGLDGDRKDSSSRYGEEVEVCASGFYEREELSRYKKKHSYSTYETVYYIDRTGTSFASPRVAGLVGLILAKRKNLTLDEAYSLVLSDLKPINDDLFKSGLLGKGQISLVGTRVVCLPEYTWAITLYLSTLILFYVFVFICDCLRSDGGGLVWLSLFFPGVIFAIGNFVIFLKWNFVLGSIYCSWFNLVMGFGVLFFLIDTYIKPTPPALGLDHLGQDSSSYGHGVKL